MPHTYQKLNLLKKRIILIILFYTVLALSIKSQDTCTYKYLVGTADPDINWKSVSFNDAAWSDGFGSIGYGDNDDSTLIDTTTSVFIRYSLRFNSDYSNYKGIIIYPDFDDGFIAYLNSIEILRVNIADSVENPGYLQTANRSHEALGYRTAGGPLLYDIPGYYIDSLQLADCDIDTLNMLAFAVFNDSINGSDLTFNFHYAVIDSLISYYYSSLDYIAKPAADSTQLPYIVIETNEFGVYDSSVIASMGIINNPSKQFNRLSDNFTDYDGRIRLKLHGTYSLRFPKKSLRIELQDSTGDNNNVSIIGLPEENDFILYAPFQDKTLIKNVFTYNLGRKMGYYAPRTRFCELVLNGSDLGLHVLTEKIKRDRNRVNIATLSSYDNSGISLTGGYILEYNHALEIVYPDSKYITSEQENYINGFIDMCENLIQNINYCSSENEYKNYIDISSLADYYIINELSLNFDAFSKSWYMYKDNDAIDGRLKYGPFWDYDVAWNYYLGQRVEGWWRYDSPILSFGSILNDTSFVHLLIDKWDNYRTGILSNEAIFSLIDSITTAIAPAIDRNYQIWPVIQYTEYGDYVGLTYTDWLDEMKIWIEGRLLWIDENIGDFDYNPVCFSSYNDYRLDNNEMEVTNCYPNPFIDELNIILYAAYPGDIKISIYDLTAIELYSESFSVTGGNNQIKMNIDNKIAPGFYTLIVIKGNELVHTQKIIKSN
jgi:hypothetical protein